MHAEGNGPDVAIVTGAGRGIGKSIALALGQSCDVLCISRSEAALATASEIRERGGRAQGVVLDFAETDQVELILGDWVRACQYKRIAAVLAAATLGPEGPLTASASHEWERTFRINVFGNLAVARLLLPRQMEHRYGRFLFFAGGGAAYAYPRFPAYAASKAALVRAVENLDADLRGAGDFATAILAPGAVETDTLARVRAAGAEVRTVVPIEEPTSFAKSFLLAQQCGFSGRFVHVRDCWRDYLDTGLALNERDLWKLRRVE